MKDRLINMFRHSDGSQWLFLSGLMLGFAGNLVIWSLAPVPLQSNWKQLLISGLCFVFAGACFSVQGWMLKELEYIARSKDKISREESVEVKKRLVSASLTRLITVAVLGLVFTVIGFVTVALGI